MHSKLLATVTFSLFILAIIFYALYAGRHILSGPQIHIPRAEIEYTSLKEFTTITGTVRNTTSITLNKASLATTKEGAFAKRVPLYAGENIFVLEANDRFGRSTTQEIVIIYSAQ